ncbi:MAG: MFS transporter [Gemmatimonadaceae bacterium]
MAKNAALGRLSALIVTAFVDMVGLLMVIPLLPFYARTLHASSLMVTVLLGSFTAAQLLSAPLWGKVSDRYGRRPALLVGLTAAAISYVVFAYATTFLLLLLSRLVQGAGGGTTGVVQAYVTDSVEPDQRAKALGWISAATNVGVALGPPVGSLALKLFGVHGPGLIAASLCLFNIAFAWRFLAESRDMTEAKEHAHKRKPSLAIIADVITHSTEPAPRLIWMYAIAMGSWQAMNAVLALFLADKFGVTADNIWPIFTFMGVISVVMRAGVLGRAVDRWGEVTLSRVGLGLMAFGLAAFPLMPSYPTLAIVVAFLPIGTALTFPCVTSLLSRFINRNERGQYMGVQQTFGGIARVIIPLWAGFAYDRFGHGIPFWTSSALVLGVLVLGLGVDDPRKREATPLAA